MTFRSIVLLGCVATAACRTAPMPMTSQGYEIKVRVRDGMPMVLIPAGEFVVQFGSTKTHQLWYLPNYYMDQHEVTNRQFLKFLESAPPGNYTTDTCAIKKVSNWVVSAAVLDLPVVGITEEGAKAYARWVGGELPSLAHFEKAAWGSSMKKDPPQTQSLDESKLVGVRALVETGRYGLKGIFGNAAEMCIEEYRTADGPTLVMGGSFHAKTVEMGMPSGDEIGTGAVGFRCVVEPAALPSYRIEWRNDLWESLDEARRRNSIVFLTLHYDG